MSRMVALTTTYKNGRKAQIGWYCPKNADMVPNSFNLTEFNNICVRFRKEIYGKTRKYDSVTVTISQSYSTVGKGHFETKMSMPLNAINRVVVFERINHILEFVPTDK